MDPFNLDYWNELATAHRNDPSYGLEKLKNNRSTLLATEEQELGDVKGKKLLHLQCHFGLDSLSLAKFNKAIVTGVDYSENAIGYARQLAEELGIPARFICSDVYDLAARDTGLFDIVMSTYGILPWLPDLDAWAAMISSKLEPGGYFLLADEHPFASTLAIDKTSGHVCIGYPYSLAKGHYLTHNTRSYFTGADITNTTQKKWPHSLSEIMNALTGAGLSIDAFHEYEHCFYSILPGMAERDGLWYLPDDPYGIPLTFLLKAVKR